MAIIRKYKIAILLVLLAGALIFVWLVRQAIVLKKAHSTFEDYYAFRGCVQLLSKTDDYGLCKTDSGQVIKIVKFDGKWYLDGDLPGVW